MTSAQTSPLRAPGGFPVVGIIGGGQLARMCQPPAVNLALTLSVLAESAEAAAALVIPSAPVGDYTDVEVVRRFAADCDVVTFDHEHVPADVLAALEADGVALHPSPSALVFAQDKLAMRRRLGAVGIPCPRWAAVQDEKELLAFGEEVGWPVVVKTPRGGYDGKGVRVVSSPQEVADWFSLVERDRAAGGKLADGLLAEEKVDFTRELALLIARSPSGQASAWPLVETVQTDGICTQVIAPAPDLDPDLAAEVTETGLRIAGELGVTGTMAIELFEVAGGSTGGGAPRVSEGGGSTGGGAPRVLVNELAMRPHNSGHWTIDGAVTSQFEQHLRAVLDLPLGDTRARSSWTVMGNVLGGEHESLYPAYRHLMARDPGLKVHLYGKGVRPGRKIGHVNVCGEDLAQLRERAQHAADYLQGVVTE